MINTVMYCFRLSIWYFHCRAVYYKAFFVCLLVFKEYCRQGRLLTVIYVSWKKEKGSLHLLAYSCLQDIRVQSLTLNNKIKRSDVPLSFSVSSTLLQAYAAYGHSLFSPLGT